MILLACALISLAAPSCATPRDTGGVRVAVRPDTVLIEVGEGRRFVNNDFVLTNTSSDSVDLVEIVLTVRDGHGTMVMQKLINENGIFPSIEAIPRRRLAPGGTVIVFNPFHDFPSGLPLDALGYDFHFRAVGRDTTYAAATLVTPRERAQRADLILPLRGSLLAYDNHDYYSHHRRLDLSHPFVKAMDVAGNSGRYAFDLSIVDSTGRMYRGDGSHNEDWYSWNQPVYAPGAGRVVQAANDKEDYEIGKTSFEAPPPPFDPMLFSGNHVVIDHGNGEFSLLAHMRKGSVRVKPGDRVRQGDELGRVGFSGSVITVHTHYQLQRGPGFGDEGLPAYFSRFERLRGKATTRVARGMVDTGELVRQLAPPGKP